MKDLVSSCESCSLCWQSHRGQIEGSLLSYSTQAQILWLRYKKAMTLTEMIFWVILLHECSNITFWRILFQKHKSLPHCNSCLSNQMNNFWGKLHIQCIIIALKYQIQFIFTALAQSVSVKPLFHFTLHFWYIHGHFSFSLFIDT